MLTVLAENIRVLENFGRGDYVDQTTVHPVGLAMLVVCGVATLTLPRRYAIWPMLVLAVFVAPAQRVVIASLDFSFLRLMVVFAWLRVLSRGEYAGFRWTLVDKLLVAWGTSTVVIYVLANPQFGMLVYKLGRTLDSVGMYFAFRWLVRDWRDFTRTAWVFVALAVPVFMAFVVENRTSRNLFAFLGGVPEITAVRQGELRCQGAFAHPILAGCYWAAVLPLIAVLWWIQPRKRLLVAVGGIACLGIVGLCNSSTPVFGVVGAMLGLVGFFARQHMRAIRWGTVCVIVGLHMVMQGPVWHLISRVSAVGGSTGYHRFQLIDHFIRRFSEWWLLGTHSTAHWFWGGQDVTNHFIAQGVTGGLLTFVLFIVLVAVCFRDVGRAVQRVRYDRAKLIMAWAIGVCLWVHCCCFIGVTYFGQNIVVLYMSLALCANVGLAAETAGARYAVVRKRPSGRLISRGVRRTGAIASDH